MMMGVGDDDVITLNSEHMQMSKYIRVRCHSNEAKRETTGDNGARWIDLYSAIVTLAVSNTFQI